MDLNIFLDLSEFLSLVYSIFMYKHQKQYNGKEMKHIPMDITYGSSYECYFWNKEWNKMM